MRRTAREIVGGWILSGVSLVNIERVLELPFGSLVLLHENEGPAPPETEILLNMICRCPVLLEVAEENFNLKKIIKNLFNEWQEQQLELLAAIRK